MRKNMKLNFLNLPEDLLEGTRELCPRLNVSLASDGRNIKVIRGNHGLSISNQNGNICIEYQKKSEFFRALGLLAEESDQSEYPRFETLGCMFDCSRNGVLKPDAVKKMIQVMALMGYNALMLYTEDTFEMKKYPYFGYMRGAYTQEELRETDRYAALFGIELIPCIQTLAHLNAIRRWESFCDIFDCDDILLIDDDKTYELIEEMVRTMSEAVRSRKIHIGMDEAHMVGLGSYLDKHGYKNRFELLAHHQKKVMEICKKYGYHPMIWSDMYFKFLSKTNDYYDTSIEIPHEIRSLVPKELNLMYWDYDTQDLAVYEKMIDNHFLLSDSVSFAGGARKWMSLGPQLQYSNQVARPALNACVEKQVKDVYVTVWGDGGSECSTFAILPVLQLFAEKCYTGDDSDARISKRLKVCANASYREFLELDKLDLVPGDDRPGTSSRNPSKYLLYQDILCGLFDRHVDSRYAAHYKKTEQVLRQIAGENGEWQYIFDYLADLAYVLALKCDMGVRLKKAYDGKDKDTVRSIAREEIPDLKKRVNALHAAMQKTWLEENKPFGMDVIDLRFGGLQARLDTAAARLGDYVSGKIAVVEELEPQRLYYDCRAESEKRSPATNRIHWEEISTACVME